MNVFVISRGLPEEGSGIFEFDQAKALADYGHNVTFIALDLRSIRRRRMFGIQALRKHSMNIVRVSFPIGALSWKIFYRFGEKFLIKGLKKAIKCYGMCDIIHTHFFENGYISLKAVEKVCPGVPIVLTEHSSAINKPLQYIDCYKKKIAYYTYNNVDYLITVSESLAKRIKENFGVKSKVIYNVADLSLFKAKYIPDENRVIDFISVGNLKSNKRMDLLIRCFCKAFHNDSNKKLIICGDGPEYSDLKKVMKDCGAGKNVVLAGKRSRSEIAEYFNESKAFILLSKSETFGVAFIEAMAAGLPVISTKSGGPECFITNDTGMLVEDDDMSIVAAMKKILKEQAKYDRNAISRYANDNFAPNIIAGKLTITYKEILKSLE